MDVDGDGVILPSEIFDVAVVANGVDGTLQFYNIADPAAPKLVNLVRLGHEATSIAINLIDRLAYVGAGSAGVAFVDLGGVAHVQPLDLDRDSLDDRILAIVPAGAEAQRVAYDAGQGLVYLATGSGGLVSVEATPPTVEIVDVIRDPLSVVTGDEESIASTRVAYTTDDALKVMLRARTHRTGEFSLLIKRVDIGDHRTARQFR